MLCFRYI